MTRAIQWLAILGVALIVGGVWSAFQNRDDEYSSPPGIHSDTKPAASASGGADKSRSTVRSDVKPAGNFWGRPETLSDHFVRHGSDFHARDADDYARQAHLFLQRAHTAGLPAKRDADGTLRIFDSRTGAFGAYNADGTTKTYFKPGSRDYFQRQPGTPINLRTAR